MNRARQLPVRQGQDCLDDPGDARRGFEMPDIRFDRADPQFVLSGAPQAQRVPYRARLDGVAHRSTGPVRLQIAHPAADRHGRAHKLRRSKGQRL